MNKLKSLVKILLFAVILIGFKCVGGETKAATNAIVDTSRKASLTITKYENKNGSKENKALKGVEFTIYNIPSDSGVENVTQGLDYIKNHSVWSYSQTTPDSGTITFSNLDLGRYLVIETKAPKNVSTKIESFLIDLPRTIDDGKGWNYDVTIYPKNVTIYGNVTLTHTNQDGTPLVGTTWKLEKKDSNGNWKEYDELGILTTNALGQINIENLEKGDYRLVQNSIADGYIMDKSNTKNFTIDLQNTNKNLTAKSEKLEIEKYVKSVSGEYTNTVGAFRTEILTWKTKADVAEIIEKMDKYSITEKFPDQLILNQDSIKVYGLEENGNEVLLQNECYTKSIINGNLKIDFNLDSLKNYKNVAVIYDTVFNLEIADSGEYEIGVFLEYTNCIDADGNCDGTYKTQVAKAETHIGMIKIFKTNSEGQALGGAKFKIATSEENAKNGIFVKNIEDLDLVTETGTDGYAFFKGLKYGEDGVMASNARTEYWIVEVQAPSDKYSLLQNPKKVIVNINSADNLINIVNKEKFDLPLTGGKRNIIFFVLGVSCVVLAIIRMKKKEEVKE